MPWVKILLMIPVVAIFGLLIYCEIEDFRDERRRKVWLRETREAIRQNAEANERLRDKGND